MSRMSELAMDLERAENFSGIDDMGPYGMSDAETDVRGNLRALSQVARWLRSDWFNPENREFLIRNFDEFHFDRLMQVVEKIRIEREKRKPVVDLSGVPF